MGWCYEFGPQIGDDCDHPMTAGERSCMCTTCGAVCTGKFGGCADVWAQGARDVAIERPRRPRAVVFATDGDIAEGGTADAGIAVDVITADVESEPRADDDRSAEVLAWLRRAFDEVHGELRSLESKVQEHQRMLATGAPPDQAVARIADETAVRIADEVAARLERALEAQAAAIASPSVEAAALEPQADVIDLRTTVATVRDIADQLRVEMARIAAFRRALADSNVRVATLVDDAAGAAAARHAERGTDA